MDSAWSYLCCCASEQADSLSNVPTATHLSLNLYPCSRCSGIGARSNHPPIIAITHFLPVIRLDMPPCRSPQVEPIHLSGDQQRNFYSQVAAIFFYRLSSLRSAR